MTNSKIVRFFLTYISHTYGTIKPLCRAAIKISVLFIFVTEIS